MKKFFGINEPFRFELSDFTALLTVLNVITLIMGYVWAPLIALVNCAIIITSATARQAHVNFYATQFALIILNIYFLIA